MKRISVIALLMMSLSAACGYPLTRPTLPPASVASTQAVNLNTEAAQLAIEVSGDLEPPPAIYGRALSDLAAIRAAYMPVSDIKARSAWDDLNTRYEAMETENNTGITILTLAGYYNIPLVAEEYAGLPHVSFAEPNHLKGDGSDVCLSITDEIYFYVFDAAGGDCPECCTEHAFWGFSTDAQSHITLLGNWEQKSGASQPAWLKDLAECRKWL